MVSRPRTTTMALHSTGAETDICVECGLPQVQTKSRETTSLIQARAHVHIHTQYLSLNSKRSKPGHTSGATQRRNQGYVHRAQEWQRIYAPSNGTAAEKATPSLGGSWPCHCFIPSTPNIKVTTHSVAMLSNQDESSGSAQCWKATSPHNHSGKEEHQHGG